MQATDNGSSQATVLWNEPDVTDNSGVIANLERSNEPGDVFDLGVHTVFYTAVDENSNTETCTFSITIVGEHPVIVWTRLQKSNLGLKLR